MERAKLLLLKSLLLNAALVGEHLGAAGVRGCVIYIPHKCPLPGGNLHADQQAPVRPLWCGSQCGARGTGKGGHVTYWVCT